MLDQYPNPILLSAGQWYSHHIHRQASQGTPHPVGMPGAQPAATTKTVLGQVFRRAYIFFISHGQCLIFSLLFLSCKDRMHNPRRRPNSTYPGPAACDSTGQKGGTPYTRPQTNIPRPCGKVPC